jgi:lipopolysaccharide/colanic/teichoic acid biosynthesis glycosyltransferase
MKPTPFAGRQALLKRSVDLVLATMGLFCFAPLMAALALAIKLSSSGPILFRQQRVGRGGRLFWLYKFRTMRPASMGPDAATGPAITAAGDARVTWIGRWLRHWKLDELPQLLNVMCGDMSLVGPRPEVPRYVRLYTTVQREVLAVRPGITGSSQIHFRHEEQLLAGHPEPEQYYITALLPAKLDLDLDYLRHAGLREDLRLLACTVLAIWQRGSRRPRTARRLSRRSA